MKTKEELEQIKEEYSELTKKLAELNENELTEISGGEHGSWICPFCGGRFGTIDEILIHSTYCSLARH